MKRAFPSDFRQNAKHRVLRISSKGKNPKPMLLSCYTRLLTYYTKMDIQQKARQLSSSHLETYINQGIIPQEFIETMVQNRSVKETECVVCEYIAKMKSEKR